MGPSNIKYTQLQNRYILQIKKYLIIVWVTFSKKLGTNIKNDFQ